MKKKLSFIKRCNLRAFLSLFILSFLFLAIMVFICSNYSDQNNATIYNTPKISVNFDGTLNLTNPEEIDGKSFYQGDTIPIKGRVFHRINGTSLENVNVILRVDNQDLSNFNDTTDINGEFTIDYNIENTLNVFSNHLIEAKVIDDLEIEYITNYTINVNTTSYFEINGPDGIYLAQESLDVNGYIRFNNGTGIGSETINYQWFNTTDTGPWTPITSNLDGSIPLILVPTILKSGVYSINFSFPQIPNAVDDTDLSISNIRIFSNFTCDWNLASEASVGQNVIIQGQAHSTENSSIKIINRQFRILYDGLLIATITTDGNGNFSYSYSIPSGTGNITLSLELIETVPGVGYSSSFNLEVTQAVAPPSPNIGIGPTQLFLMIGLPIIIGAVIILGIYGFLYYKKNVSTSRVINIPLEDKITNLKILKDSGRLEEAISYLFNAIYMDLVAAKYGRTRKITETIRDFAIISVKDFKLNPSSIYPFIQKVEQIIYAKPFEISEEVFYQIIELFSPIYFQLTGYHFVLNF
ncbi:MAG: hypothetical protein GF317_17135 [Candidatus Lokiarchaeota archaeon]|nr:hypothetical protein [Candidatus Lokiarchaeota archaeon]MBD3201237.1 hypothetical protein [Candidatus Lokiarchaeota archaeon]